ncbi:MAG: insulinase family protein, partial [bacterium]|nr:insulinase family protein [bacterium]
MTGLLGIFLFILIDRPLGANSRKKSANSPSINVTTFQLSNGLKVILAPLDNVEAACVMLYHLTGARDDPPGSRGISHLYQVLMLAGTQNLDAMDRVNVIKKYGGSTDSSVNYDNSVFCQMIPESEINNALWFESERISSLKLEEQVIDRLKKIEYKRFQRLNTTNPHFRAVNWVKSKVFEGTVYQTPKYGNMEKIAGFSNRKIREVYDNFRNLSDIIVVISGKFNEVTIKDAVNKRFSGLSPGKRQRK